MLGFPKGPKEFDEGEEHRGPKMHELADQGGNMSLGDAAGMGDLGAEMIDYHAKNRRVGHTGSPDIDVPPAPPQTPPRGQRTLDEF